MEVGAVVKYAKPQDGEADLRFTLIELNGDRCLIELISDDTIRPRETVLTEDVCAC